MSDYERLQGLARMIAGELGKATPRPKLRVVDANEGINAARSMDAITRDSHLRMVRHLRKRCGLDILVDQATFGRGSIDVLEDHELAKLHADMQTAREALAEGIPLEDTGLIRNPMQVTS